MLGPPLRLLHVTNVPEQLRCFLGGQVRFMRGRGIHVEAISAPGELLDEFGRVERIPTHAVPMTRAISPWKDAVSIARLWRKMRGLRPHVVHAHSPKGGLLAMIAATLARVPLRIYHIRGLPFDTATGWKRRLLSWTERISCRLAHEVYCVSHSMRNIALEAGFAPADKLKVFGQGSGNGVDARGRFNSSAVGAGARQHVRQFYHIPGDALVLGFVGRIGFDKGIAELVAAWQTLRSEFPRLHLLMVGPLEKKDGISPQDQRVLQTDPRIHLVGVEWNTPPLYVAMDVVVLPSYREGLPNVPLEAAAMERPVVATAIPGCVDAVEHGVTGLLVPPRDVLALCGALRVYLNDEQLRIAHGAAGRKRMLRDFSPEAIWREVFESYRRLALRRGHRFQFAAESEPRIARAA